LMAKLMQTDQMPSMQPLKIKNSAFCFSRRTHLTIKGNQLNLNRDAAN